MSRIAHSALSTRHSEYDAIVVGARAAGAATAMLLARRGARVLVFDRARYGSDTLSTHALMRGGVLQLKRWGLLDRVQATGVPAIRQVAFHYPDQTVRVDLRPGDGVDALYAPRRTVLDPILVDAAMEAGAEFRFGVAVEELRKDPTGRVIGIRGRHENGRAISAGAGIVIGADGIRSAVAMAAGAPMTREARSDGAVVYGYFKNLDASGFEWAYGSGISAGVIPTNDGEVCLFVGGSSARFRQDVMADLIAGFHRILAEAAPALAERAAAATQTARFRGFAGIRGYYRRPWGNGWALVGDAGYFRDPITTHGITDAFRDAELLTRAIAGQSSFPEYERIRDRVTGDLFEVTDRIATYRWSEDEIRHLLRDVSKAMKAEVDLILSLDAPAAA